MGIPQHFETPQMSLSVLWPSHSSTIGHFGLLNCEVFAYSYGWKSGSTVDLIILFVISRTHSPASTNPSAIEDSWEGKMDLEKDLSYRIWECFHSLVSSGPFARVVRKYLPNSVSAYGPCYKAIYMKHHLFFCPTLSDPNFVQLP